MTRTRVEPPVPVPPGPVDLARLAEALEASWDEKTAYRGITLAGNPAFGQCYPTSRVVQWLLPGTEIAVGEVWTGESTEHHFWNVREGNGSPEWIDLSWQQFPAGSTVRRHRLLDRNALGDSPGTVERCGLLLRRVLAYLADETGP
jgi:hypothetical protein